MAVDDQKWVAIKKWPVDTAPRKRRHRTAYFDSSESLRSSFNFVQDETESLGREKGAPLIEVEDEVDTRDSTRKPEILPHQTSPGYNVAPCIRWITNFGIPIPYLGCQAMEGMIRLLKSTLALPARLRSSDLTGDRADCKRFYRAQSNESFTMFSGERGFEVRGKWNLLKATVFWLNGETVESHIDPRSRPEEHTPLISVYESFDDARFRASFLLMLGHTEVCVAEIAIPNPVEQTVWGTHSGEDVELPVISDGGETKFMSIFTANDLLGVRPRERGEWLALGSIPSNLVQWIVPFTSVTVMDREMGANMPPTDDSSP